MPFLICSWAKVELQEEVKAAQDEKDTLVTQIKQSETSIKNLENEVERLSFQFS
jgi:predicted  nucleic acid-binding Zn-ribbon protein